MLINFKKEDGKRTSIKLSRFDLDMFCYYIGFYSGNEFDENNEKHVAYVKMKIHELIDKYRGDYFEIASLRAIISGGLRQMVKAHHQQFGDYKKDFQLALDSAEVSK
jgi:hypothetical protein